MKPSFKTASIFLPLSLAFGLASDSVPTKVKPNPILQYRSLLKEIPAAVATIGRERPSLKNEIDTSYKYLRQQCPAMSKVDIRSPWNLADWINRNISEKEWRVSPYSFRMNSFRAVAVQKNTATKIQVLGKLYNAIPFHPAFIVWTDDGLEKLIPILETDPFLVAERKAWDSVIKDDKRLEAYSNRVGELLVKTYLSNHDISLPKVIIHREDIGPRGYFNGNSNLIGLNFGPNTPFKNYTEADGTITHEFFHFVELVLRNWSIEKKLENNIPLNDSGEKFFYAFNSNLGQVPDTVNVDTYKIAFHERAAFYIKNQVMRHNVTDLISRQTDWLESGRTTQYGIYTETGSLPAACNLK